MGCGHRPARAAAQAVARSARPLGNARVAITWCRRSRLQHRVRRRVAYAAGDGSGTGPEGRTRAAPISSPADPLARVELVEPSAPGSLRTLCSLAAALHVGEGGTPMTSGKATSGRTAGSFNVEHPSHPRGRVSALRRPRHTLVRHRSWHCARPLDRVRRCPGPRQFVDRGGARMRDRMERHRRDASIRATATWFSS
jgi:hypothetical protein